ncbi:hypothetical protein [Providencia hangzhouensis]|uniref:hypothetical protein n=1 Tax=Providencia hangzhouensis TaxID=3031799 RepID=UPI0034DCD8FA
MLTIMKITLTNEQKQKIKIQHSTTRNGRVCDHIKAVIHACNGWSAEEIADAHLINESTIRQHIKDYL